MRLIAALLFLAALLSYSPPRACSGSSPNLVAATWADVQLCYNAAVDGDTITKSTGTESSSANTVFDGKYVKLICGGTCTITDNSGDATDFLNITESTAGSVRVEGFDFIEGSGTHSNPHGVIVTTYAASGYPILIKGNSYTGTNYTADFIIAGSAWRGVIWDNTMTDVAGLGGGSCNNQAAFVRIKNLGLTAVWTEVPYYGMDDTNGNKNLYIEDNTLDNVHQGIDCDANCRVVIRHNILINSGLVNHGVDTGNISGRYMVIHHNTFEWNQTVRCAPDLPAGATSFIFLRGAPALIHDNIIPDLFSMAWGDPYEVNFADEKLRRSGGAQYLCWDQGYPSRHQVGWGYSVGGTEAGMTGEFQDLEPVYLWGNTGDGNYNAPLVYDYQPDECGNGLSSTTYIVEDREYYLDTAKPGYTAYTYPHPLQGEGAAGVGGGIRLRKR